MKNKHSFSITFIFYFIIFSFELKNLDASIFVMNKSARNIYHEVQEKLPYNTVKFHRVLGFIVVIIVCHVVLENKGTYLRLKIIN